MEEKVKDVSQEKTINGKTQEEIDKEIAHNKMKARKMGYYKGF